MLPRLPLDRASANAYDLETDRRRRRTTRAQHRQRSRLGPKHLPLLHWQQQVTRVQFAVALQMSLQMMWRRSLGRTQIVGRPSIELQLRCEVTWRSLNGYSSMAVVVKQWKMVAH